MTMNHRPAKKWYLSKTLVASLVGLVCAGLQTWKGWVIDPSQQVVLVLLLMAVLRLVTNNKVVFTTEKSHGSGGVPGAGGGPLPADPADPVGGAP